MQEKIKDLAQQQKDELIKLRRDLHRHPESGWTEFRTTSIIAITLQKLGYNIKMGEEIICRDSMMGVPSEENLQQYMQRAVKQGADAALVEKMAGGLTGVVTEIGNGQGPVLALRFDIDALDVTEAEDDNHRPWREGFNSKNPGTMHACGHDGHVSIGLGVAKVLSALKDEINGTIRLIFQPAEEGVRGAGPMVDAGIVDGVDYILGGHIGFQAKRSGQLICSADRFLATTKFDVTFKGTPAHAGAAPEEGRNALLAASCATLNLHAITRHGHGASRMTVGVMQAGEGRNIIPAHAVIKAESRGETSEIDEFMFNRAKKVIRAAADMYDVDFDMKLMGQTKSGCSDISMMERIKKASAAVDFFDQSDIVDKAEMRGSEDYAHMMSTVQQHGGQGTYFMIGSTLAAGHHDNRFDFDESCLAPAVELISSVAMDIVG